jgi:hypothetical protein
MPILTGPIDPNGALVQVTIGVSKPRRDLLAKNNFVVPADAPILALIDTGATHSCVAAHVLTQLDEKVFGQMAVVSAATGLQPSLCDVYLVSFCIPHPLPPLVIPVTGPRG